MEQRTFIPGSRWLYFKLYTGAKTADDVLARCVGPLARSLTESGAVRKWFFIRYSDPSHHLRLRFDMGTGEHYGEVMRRVCEALSPEVDSGAVTQVMCDTYVRELERYGAGSMETIEELFYADSRAVVSLLDLFGELSTERREEMRWKLAVRIIDDTLETLACTSDAKSALAGRLAEGFRNEFGFTAHTYTRQLNDMYRQHRREVDDVLFGRHAFGPDAENALCLRRDSIQSLGSRLRGMEAAGTLAVEMNNLAGSIIHMSMNRLFKSHNRVYELAVYDLISRSYKSAAAMSGKKAESTVTSDLEPNL